MYFQAIIPFKPVNPKTRLSCVLSQPEREAFARMMLDDVIAAVLGAGCRPIILCTEPFFHKDAETVVKNKGLNEALNDCLQKLHHPVLIIMADLPLATPKSVAKVLETGAEIAIVPGRGGGTNALFIRNPQAFHVDYYGASFLDHKAIADEMGMSLDIIDSFRLHTDVDEKEDLVEVILHGTGKSRIFLKESGFSLFIEKGRVGVQRNTHE
jgi:2-phospho-L-lactate guanylyltransferase